MTLEALEVLAALAVHFADIEAAPAGSPCAGRRLAGRVGPSPAAGARVARPAA